MRIGLLWCVFVLSVVVLQVQYFKCFGMLGIYFVVFSVMEVFKVGMDVLKGIKVVKVMLGFVVEVIGIVEGDLVFEVNGEVVESLAGIVVQLGEFSVGEEVVLIIIRDGCKLI